MNFFKLAFISLVSSSFLFASNSLLQDAKNAGLKPIPQSKLELLKLIDDPKNPLTDRKIELGKKLYFDPRLSKSGLISCNTCHNLGLGGVDGVSAAIGNKWTANPHHLNSPTVYNAVFFKAQFWDGRSPDLPHQAQGPTLASPEMAGDPKTIAKKINSIPEYVKEFKKAYGKNVEIDFKNITEAIALFEKILVTPSRYDDYLNGDDSALSKKEKEGLRVFLNKGCASCHNGIALGGTMAPFEVAGKYKFRNVGDFLKINKKKMVKVPTLRNITETAPYFHNGKIWSLKEAVKEMGSVELGIKISDKEAQKIVTFLKALKGRKPLIIYPQLPESTDNTPKPID